MCFRGSLHCVKFLFSISFDQVNCRRAAAAAFQENVGRQGNYPHGIDIVNIADYFSLSSRVNSYLQVAVSIAHYEGYLYPFVDELLYNKICHWVCSA